MSAGTANPGTVPASLRRQVAAPFVVAIVPTYNRKRELAALLELLEETRGLQAVVVADNAADPNVRELVERSTVCSKYLAMKMNAGPAPSINRAIEFAHQEWEDSITHYWILDDDVRFAPDVLERFLEALDWNRAQLVAPVITDPSGAVFAWPYLKSSVTRKIFAQRKRTNSPEFAEDTDLRDLPEIRACLGSCYLMDRVCYESLAGMREDFWLLGEDVEFTARIARKFRAVFCPQIAIEHFWGTPSDEHNPGRWAYWKACAALQNNLFMFLHLPHVRFTFRPFLGSLKRFIQLHLRSREAVYDLLWILWYASVGNEPAGARSGQLLRERRRKDEPK